MEIWSEMCKFKKFTDYVGRTVSNIFYVVINSYSMICVALEIAATQVAFNYCRDRAYYYDRQVLLAIAV